MYKYIKDRHGHDRMVGGFTTTCSISAYHHYSCEFESRSWRGAFNTLSDKVCQWPSTVCWYSLCTLVSSTIKTDSHDITEILLKVVLNTITLSNPLHIFFWGRGITTILLWNIIHGMLWECAASVCLFLYPSILSLLSV